jgi:hypothetical protein
MLSGQPIVSLGQSMCGEGEAVIRLVRQWKLYQPLRIDGFLLWVKAVYVGSPERDTQTGPLLIGPFTVIDLVKHLL